ncbi:uncharacterized protein LOC18440571 isoform X2 [Amborella trichopoda]|uniref:uncharacterized protein LOC18440571 isoform X2 n=1 Tax=Amborella trichopoda TaxID=13333 RepID=UPI0005D3741B|nr:uncharacterized protein LOC18440571 isoform X2 [Amborella trichopoda]|eukprot:XP_011625688.1 uncharacterized protein LOC18440571 isoform X2 [Amborella trichopoda]
MEEACSSPKQPVKFALVDAFTNVAFRGNPAAVCVLEEERESKWMQDVAIEINTPMASFLYPTKHSKSRNEFHIRWFTIAQEVELCGHATLAAAYFLFSTGLEGDEITFHGKSGILVVKKVESTQGGNFEIQLDFPALTVGECGEEEIPLLPETLNGASMTSVKKTSAGDLLVELSSVKDLMNLRPQFDEIRKCKGRGVIVTALAPIETGYDFLSRFFCPKVGVNEASERGGKLVIEYKKDANRVIIRGEAIIVMMGTLLV